MRTRRDTRAGAIDTVIIYDISRGSRDVDDWFAFRKAMLYLGVTVISATGQRIGDLTTGQDFLLELITVGMGQMEVLNTREKASLGWPSRPKPVCAWVESLRWGTIL